MDPRADIDIREYSAQIETPLGPVAVLWGYRGVREIRLGEAIPTSPRLPTELGHFIRDLQRYFGGKRISFEVPLDLGNPPPFREKVLRECARIPYGKITTYGSLAEAVGQPRAARAVGQAVGHNPIPIVIPCHRVLASGGGLGGFGSGLEWKRFLLRLEGIPFKDIDS